MVVFVGLTGCKELVKAPSRRQGRGEEIRNLEGGGGGGIGSGSLGGAMGCLAPPRLAVPMRWDGRRLPVTSRYFRHTHCQVSTPSGRCAPRSMAQCSAHLPERPQSCSRKCAALPAAGPDGFVAAVCSAFPPRSSCSPPSSPHRSTPSLPPTPLIRPVFIAPHLPCLSRTRPPH